MHTPELVSPLRLSAILAAVNSLAVAHSGAQWGVQTIYVDDDAPPGGNGSSWQAAFRDLQDALDLIQRDHPAWPLVHVAQGNYTPDRGTLDRTSSFALTSGVSLIGGFAGLGAPIPSERDPARFVSVLSADLLRDDAPDFANRSDNAYHVIDASRTDGSADIDGFTIRGGHADGAHGLHDRGSAIAGHWNYTSGLELVRCRIVDNFATSGAAIHQNYGWLTLTDSLVAANHTTAHISAGVVMSGFLTMTRTRFAGNINAPGSSAGSAITAEGTTSILDSLFDANGAGGPALSNFGPIQIVRSTFANNATADHGAIRLAYAPYVAIGGCIIHSASPGSAAIVAEHAGDIHVGSSCIIGGESSVRAPGAELHWYSDNIDANPLFASAAGPDGVPATWQDNDYSLAIGSPCIDTGSIGFFESETDLADAPRVVSGYNNCHRRADMGAFEFQPPPPPPPRTIFVRAGAPAGGDGISWATALRSITDALATPGVREVRVAAGTYTPHPADRLALLEIQCDLTLLGGFAGTGDSPDARDPVDFPTILSGDLLANDDDSPESREDNSYRIIALREADAVIDGFTIERNYGADPFNGGGAALRLDFSTLALSNCVIQDCICVGPQAADGAVTSYTSSLTISNCTFARNRSSGDNYAAGAALVAAGGGELFVSDSTFIDNSAESAEWTHGGAVVCRAYRALFVNSTFARNHAVAVSDTGGGRVAAGALYAESSELRAINCTFTDNEARAGDASGIATSGAAHLYSGFPSAEGCLFNGNSTRAFDARAGALSIGGLDPLLSNSTVALNHAISTGPATGPGGVHTASDPIYTINVVNTIIWGNSNASGQILSAQLDTESGHLSADWCCIQGLDGSIPGVHSFSADPLFLTPTDLRLAPNSPCIDTGNASLLPPDTSDLDHDGDTKEQLPLDASNLPRIIGPALDIGAFETQPTLCPADYNNDAILNTADFFTFLTDFFTHNPRADINADSTINSTDFFVYINAFLAGC